MDPFSLKLSLNRKSNLSESGRLNHMIGKSPKKAWAMIMTFGRTCLTARCRIASVNEILHCAADKGIDSILSGATISYKVGILSRCAVLLVK